jgi:AcrR family transcriptional regulator
MSIFEQYLNVLNMIKNQVYSNKKRILKVARRRFFTFGYSRVTMDELAIELQMSKKTLYQFFKSKQLLLESVIYDFFQEFNEKINEILKEKSKNKNNDRLNTLKYFLSLIQSQISQFNAHAFEDIHRNNPKAWQMISNLREKMINNELRELLKQGKKEGTVRKDIDLDIIVLIILNTVESVATPEVISQFSYSTEEVVEMIAKIVMFGILTPENLIET